MGYFSAVYVVFPLMFYNRTKLMIKERHGTLSVCVINIDYTALGNLITINL